MTTLDPRSLTPPDLVFARHIGLPLEEGGYWLESGQGGPLRVEAADKTITIRYAKTCERFRGLALLKEGIAPGQVKEQPCALDSLGVMCDCSRNAVLRPEAIKRYILDIAALGFDQLQLYTEDTFEVEEYPYFGHWRGRYSREEIQEVDAFARQYGVELVPAVQTLAHLNAIFRWRQFDPIHDTGDILLCGGEETYVFLDRLIASLRSMYTTDKINIGMDEAHMLGLGQYLTKNGYCPPTDIFLAHLGRVSDILRRYGFRPMMWSDMFFKLASGKRSYEPLEAVAIDPRVVEQIPEELSLVYWNYGSTSENYYDLLMRAHLDMGREVIFAGGFRKWAGFCPTLQDSFDASRAALNSVRRCGIRRVLVTAWGDDGGEGAMGLTLPGLALYAEGAYTGDSGDGAVDRRLRALFGYGLDEFRLLEEGNYMPGVNGAARTPSNSKSLLWNDPLLGVYDRHVIAGSGERFARLAARLEGPAAADNRLCYLFETIHALYRLLAVKAELGCRIRAAYQAGSREDLRALCASLPEVIRRLDGFHQAFRRGWLKENKIFGFDVQDIRFGGLRARLVYTQEALEQYLNGAAASIAELEEPCLYMDCRGEEADGAPFSTSYWRQLATVGVL